MLLAQRSTARGEAAGTRRAGLDAKTQSSPAAARADGTGAHPTGRSSAARAWGHRGPQLSSDRPSSQPKHGRLLVPSRRARRATHVKQQQNRFRSAWSSTTRSTPIAHAQPDVITNLQSHRAARMSLRIWTSLFRHTTLDNHIRTVPRDAVYTARNKRAANRHRKRSLPHLLRGVEFIEVPKRFSSSTVAASASPPSRGRVHQGGLPQWGELNQKRLASARRRVHRGQCGTTTQVQASPGASPRPRGPSSSRVI
jgi:hypothetical protein